MNDRNLDVILDEVKKKDLLKKESKREGHVVEGFRAELDLLLIHPEAKQMAGGGKRITGVFLSIELYTGKIDSDNLPLIERWNLNDSTVYISGRKVLSITDDQQRKLVLTRLPRGVWKCDGRRVCGPTDRSARSRNGRGTGARLRD